jgi:hypothetical protein
MFESDKLSGEVGAVGGLVVLLLSRISSRSSHKWVRGNIQFSALQLIQVVPRDVAFPHFQQAISPPHHTSVNLRTHALTSDKTGAIRGTGNVCILGIPNFSTPVANASLSCCRLVFSGSPISTSGEPLDLKYRGERGRGPCFIAEGRY